MDSQLLNALTGHGGGPRRPSASPSAPPTKNTTNNHRTCIFCIFCNCLRPLIWQLRESCNTQSSPVRKTNPVSPSPSVCREGPPEGRTEPHRTAHTNVVLLLSGCCYLQSGRMQWYAHVILISTFSTACPLPLSRIARLFRLASFLILCGGGSVRRNQGIENRIYAVSMQFLV